MQVTLSKTASGEFVNHTYQQHTDLKNEMLLSFHLVKGT